MATVEGIMRDTLSSNYNLQSSGPWNISSRHFPRGRLSAVTLSI